MNLYLLRHGEAESQASSPDGRQLTAQGHDDVINVARQFADRHLKVDQCYVSPALRARQTAADFLSQEFGDIDVVVTDVLTAERRAAEVITFLGEVSADNVLLVSHNPIMSELLALLTDGNVDNMRILGTAHLACITLDIPGLGMGRCSGVLAPDESLVPAS